MWRRSHTRASSLSKTFQFSNQSAFKDIQVSTTSPYYGLVPLEPLTPGKYSVIIWDFEKMKTKYKINFSQEINKIFFVNGYLIAVSSNNVKLYDAESFELIHSHQSELEIIDSYSYTSQTAAKSFVLLKLAKESKLNRKPQSDLFGQLQRFPFHQNQSDEI